MLVVDMIEKDLMHPSKSMIFLNDNKDLKITFYILCMVRVGRFYIWLHLELCMNCVKLKLKS